MAQHAAAASRAGGARPRARRLTALVAVAAAAALASWSPSPAAVLPRAHGQVPRLLPSARLRELRRCDASGLASTHDCGGGGVSSSSASVGGGAASPAQSAVARAAAIFGAAVTFAFAAALLWLPVEPVAALEEVTETNWTPAPDLDLPVVTEEELLARWTTPTAEVLTQPWFKRGGLVFKYKCAGCHSMDPEKNDRYILWKEKLQESGRMDPKRLQFIIRYGVKKMPGYSADCTDYAPPGRCATSLPMGELDLRLVQDFTLNRVNNGWKPLPPDTLDPKQWKTS